MFVTHNYENVDWDRISVIGCEIRDTMENETLSEDLLDAVFTRAIEVIKYELKLYTKEDMENEIYKRQQKVTKDHIDMEPTVTGNVSEVN